MNRLAGKVALVTGSSAGLGAAIFAWSVAAGTRVCVADPQQLAAALEVGKPDILVDEYELKPPGWWR